MTADRPDVREWLEAVPARLIPCAHGHDQLSTFLEHQLRLLEEAVERRYLFDPEPLLLSFTSAGDYAIEDDPARAWNWFLLVAKADLFCPAWCERIRQGAFLESGAILPPRYIGQGANFVPDIREPRHFSLWRDYCGEVLCRPPVLVGRFGPPHVNLAGQPDILGVQVTTFSHYARFAIQTRTWGRLLQLVAPMTPLAHERGWIYFDNQTLASQVPAEKAEMLASSICDVLEEGGWRQTPGPWREAAREAVPG